MPARSPPQAPPGSARATEARREVAMPGHKALARLALSALLAGASGQAIAQPDGGAAARVGEIAHAQKMRQLFPDSGGTIQATPLIIPELEIDRDPGGGNASFPPKRPTTTNTKDFFQDLWTNRRTPLAWHQP